jgi:hypothetical protein
MNTRQRSPSYPSTSLAESIDIVAKLHKAVRTNAVDREVAAKELGYSGISGRSATVLSNLIQYGLIEKAGKNEVRVSSRAVEILHPDSPTTKAAAIRDAAMEPELFQSVTERFTDGPPSTNALHSFFVKEGFTDTAIPSAIRAFQETYTFAQNAIESGSHVKLATGVSESKQDQSDTEAKSMMANTQTSGSTVNPGRFAEERRQQLPKTEGPEYLIANNKIWLNGVVANQEQAQELLDFIKAVMPLLRKSEQAPSSSLSAEGKDD